MLRGASTCRIARAASCPPARYLKPVRNVSSMSAVTEAAAAVLAAGSQRPELGTATQPTAILTWNCPYAQRSWIALLEKGIHFKPAFVDLKSKPEWFFPLNPYGRVPTIAWQDESGEHSMYESLIVNEYLEDAFPSPSLLPPTPLGRAQTRLLVDQFGVKVGAAFGRVMFAATEEDTAAASAALDDALQWLEGALHPTGPFALGDSFTLADCAIAPFLIRLQLIEALNGYKVPAGLSRVAAYQDAILARPSVQGSMAAAPDSSRPYLDQLVDTYKVYVEDRKKAAAASKP